MATGNDSGPCFFCRKVPAAGQKGTLDEGETHHAGAARRIRVGDEIGLIDGEGVRALAVVETASHRSLTFAVRERIRIPPPKLSVFVATAVPKGERFRTLIDMLTQIGVAGIEPLICERSAVKPRRSVSDRWRRIAIEACKQSRNPYLPRIDEPRGVQASLAQVEAGGAIAFADVNGSAIQAPLPGRGAFHLYIGPEGGFTDAEIGVLRAAGASPVNLGGNVLRVETAAVVAAVLALASR